MDRPPAHHPDCTCGDDERVVSASNATIDQMMHVVTSHQLCSYNTLVAAYFVLEFMRDAVGIAAEDDADEKAKDVAKNFYRYSLSVCDDSKRRSMN